MIEITDHAGRKHFVAPAHISDIREIELATGVGIRSHVRLTDGRVIQARDEASMLASAIFNEQRRTDR